MSTPTVTHRREFGGSRDAHRIVVEVERTATLNESLSLVTGRSEGRIFLTTNHGMGQDKAHTYVIQPEAARLLADALTAAAIDVEDMRVENAASSEREGQR